MIDIIAVVLSVFAAYILGRWRGSVAGYRKGYRQGRQELADDRMARLKEQGHIDEDGRILLSAKSEILDMARNGEPKPDH